MSFSDLPDEIVVAILRTALDLTATPTAAAAIAVPRSAILCVCQRFRDIGTECLYGELRFDTAEQLCLFALSDYGALPDAGTGAGLVVAPRSMAVDLAGGARAQAQRGVLHLLRDALLKCRQLARARSAALARARGERGREHEREEDVRLRQLRLRMHSYAQDAAAVDVLERGLQAVSPDTFEWTGPDPDHHFSIAIVPPIASCLLKQFSAWKHIREITVTNVSFATGIDAQDHHQGPFPPPPLMADVPTLRSLYIGQATFLSAQAVAGMLCQEGMARLEQVRLVDAYSESIWGPRLRRSDIEKAAVMLPCSEDPTAMIARVKKVVMCERKTERIMGGDRAEGTHILD